MLGLALVGWLAGATDAGTLASADKVKAVRDAVAAMRKEIAAARAGTDGGTVEALEKGLATIEPTLTEIENALTHPEALTELRVKDLREAQLHAKARWQLTQETVRRKKR